MRFLVKVSVDPKKIQEFGQSLQKNVLDRRLIKSETFCLSQNPHIGYSIWEAEDQGEFDTAFNAWKLFYTETEVQEVIDPQTAMKRLLGLLS